ncbi:DegT/DnrJ/EryC1/StrS aminotransferase [Syntrophobotulus glycolicus DSM 8271]|uniref:DegT/DnrJ/EryC1/StrS aminotransferase n=1 Tax=Syntrophobotulus glycolicus (strain DSM 8271 / FlGlyR) TaxID=645991 RepID=F0SXM0_SYNGF|nr:DegT/DnrJ/EryC1/StrS family aminotransferase [Syntrophobotulus glycolicus]ADY55853.1 DegT/DnrJ/EryC1/StrS aminotransferase [Syntrophobotulus glycolicus DSM 8271]
MDHIEGFPNPFYITQPLMPEWDELSRIMKSVFESNQLSNNGKMVMELENQLADFLGTDCLSVFCNGTIALQVACRALRLSGEVITTPFTFAATVHALTWSNLKPVFCDIQEDSLNLDPDLIESLITEKTTGILPVHVFGTPCNVEKIQQIADKYGLKVLYDAAHAFGVKIKDKPIASYGDISMFSFHATKIYHTIEGGALACNNPYLKERLDSLRNFGINNDSTVKEPGTNGKLNEIQASVGLLLLKKVQAEIEQRKYLTDLYRQLLHDLSGLQVYQDIEGIRHNYPYFAVKIDQHQFGLTRDELHEKLLQYNVISRKYFYPLCSNFQCYKDLPSASETKLPIANKTANSILALPLHGRMCESDVKKICTIIRKVKPK